MEKSKWRGQGEHWRHRLKDELVVFYSSTTMMIVKKSMSLLIHNKAILVRTHFNRLDKTCHSRLASRCEVSASSTSHQD